MLRIAFKMLVGDGAKYAGLLFGIAFTSFLITFAAAFFCGFMTRGYALVAENPAVDVWVMDASVTSAEQTTNLPDSALARVRSVAGVQTAMPLALASVEARYASGSFQTLQMIGVDDATLAGVPRVAAAGAGPGVLRLPDSAVIDAGGTEGKLETPRLGTDQWQRGPPHLDVPTRPLAAGDEVLINDHRVVIAGYAGALPRYPPRPLMYMTLANFLRVVPPERRRLTFVLVTAARGVAPQVLARRIESATGLRARTSTDFEADTVRWSLVNSEDVGDVGTMLSLAVTVGFGVTAVMLYMFTTGNLRYYAVLKAMGATPRMLLGMIFAQAGVCALLGTGLGLGICGIVGPMVASRGFPFRMMWFTPVLGAVTVAVVSVLAALVSARPALRLDPSAVWAAQ